MSSRYILYVLLAATIISSCNKDEVILADEEPSGYYRPKTPSSQAECSQVLDYTPAPGQFINEPKSGFDGVTTPKAATKYAQKRLSERKYLSLGGFGGYVVVGFDHSIDNLGGYDFAIQGNSFDGSSEPGIVWVMQDENGNGKADDVWYELRGSETGKATTIPNYAVTYYRPTGAGGSVKWVDSEGLSGEIDYLSSHQQESYYPAWISEQSYTLQGTRLEARNYDKSGNGSHWVQPAYDWGYADNYSAIDRYEDRGTQQANHFSISDAIDAEGRAVELEYIDFIKIQTALNAKSGWLGECSTEILGIWDCNINLK